MDATDKTILNTLQTNFSLSSRPYQRIAEALDISEQEVISRIKNLKEAGIIRRIGATFDASKMGYISTLCAAKVNKESIEAFVALVNAFPNVSHNYLRTHSYNIWFTLSAESEEALETIIGEIKEKSGVEDILSLRAKETFKLDARFLL
ncbi:MAG: AsnC family transcriptional regulator [Deltaproteobacteria bacterium]